ncbi:MAG: helix-turn-helix domain-containing protein [Sulfitobacter sp.]
MNPVSKLFMASPKLSGCLFGAIHRDTRRTVLADADRVNHFPASPLFCVTLLRHGDLFVLPADRDWNDLSNATKLPRISVFPPSDLPISSWSPNAIEATTFGFYADAWMRLGGSLDANDVPTPIHRALDVFDRQNNPETGWTSFCQVLEPEWTKYRPSAWRPIADISDWARTVQIRAAFSGRGRSVRAFQRQLKRLSGHSKRQLDFFSSFENTHRLILQDPDLSPAELAIDAGYADQSHLGRTLRRATGFSPAHLNRAIAHEEPFWCYRLLGERF